jgi:hypothetical protein
VAFIHGATLPDPDWLLQGSDKFMRHVELTPGTETNAAALNRLINAAYSDIQARAGTAKQTPKRVVRLPDFDFAKSAVLNTSVAGAPGSIPCPAHGEPNLR